MPTSSPIPHRGQDPGLAGKGMCLSSHCHVSLDQGSFAEMVSQLMHKPSQVLLLFLGLWFAPLLGSYARRQGRPMVSSVMPWRGQLWLLPLASSLDTLLSLLVCPWTSKVR